MNTKQSTYDDNDELLRRSTRAYFRKHGANADQPSNKDWTVEEHAGNAYSILRNVNGVLAVYLVSDNGLKGLDKQEWPEAIK